MPAIVLQRMEGLADENPMVYECFRDLVDQLNQVMPNVLMGTSNPESVIPGAPGAIYIQSNPSSGALAINVKDQEFGTEGWANLGSFGSIPPSASPGFQAVATPNNITFYFDGTNGSQIISILKADGSKVQVPGGRIIVNGLQPNTTYFFYPFYSERTRSLQFVPGGNVGSPAIAFLANNSNAIQQARLTFNIPLTAGVAINVTTPNSGSSPSSVGGGFGGTGRLA